MPDEKKNIYLTVHKNFVREGIEYSGGTFNSVTLPRGTVINGQDVGYYQFSPLYVNPSRRGEDWRDIPLLKERDVWLRKTILDEYNQPVLDAEGHRRYDTVVVSPMEIKSALDQQRKEYLDSLKTRSLHDRADTARRSTEDRRREGRDREPGLAKEDIPF
ncbi:DNA gyrase [Eggerthella sp.]|uniref:DNA gyrase n=1 Tax=Eggerthellaceae TaxID=1643826 RepID=UPI00284024AC|nr:DNA gyrase [Eggerthella sp.]MDR3847672.1 DNA gyrase [Eggerthella sp.]